MRRLSGAIRCGVATGVLVGCYRPSLPEDQPCSSTDACPGSLTCDLASHTCVDQPPDAARFATISTSNHHVCGIDPAGALFCWGDNRFGQLGNGDVETRLVPTRVGTETDWQVVSAGESNTCGLRGNALFCWGRDLSGNSNHDLLPAQIDGSWTAVSASDNGYCAIDDAGGVSCRWQDTFDMVAEVATVVAVKLAVAHRSICVLDGASALSCWGENQFGQLGTGDAVAVNATQPNVIAGSWAKVALGGTQTCALGTNGSLSCWGTCSVGQIGRDTLCLNAGVVDSDVYTDVATGNLHTCAVRQDGVLVCFGQNRTGELGEHGGVFTPIPTPITELEGWTAVTAGDELTCGLRGDHETWCWGSNRHGELGDDGGGIAFEPVPIDGGPWASVRVGYHSSCGIQTDGSLWCWGANAWSQLGDGTTFQRSRPVQIGSDHDWTAVSPGRTFSCGLRAPGSLWCWGDNTGGTFGNGSVNPSNVPTQIGAFEDWTAIAVDIENTCGVRTGELFCWGTNVGLLPQSRMGVPLVLNADPDNEFTGVVNGRAFEWTVNDPGPAEMTVFDWTVVDEGADHVCGLRGEELWCFGNNGAGQLGCGDLVTHPDAIRELSSGSWSAVSAGGAATCAIATDGHLACWGAFDMLGIGKTATNAQIPMTVGSAKWQAISVGTDDACGIQVDGTLACWGNGHAGGRGDGHGGHERPIRVVQP